MRRRQLTKEQNLEFTCLADGISVEEIAVHYTLSRAEIEIVNNGYRQPQLKHEPLKERR